MIEDISKRLMADFATCLQSRLAPAAASDGGGGQVTDAPAEAQPIKGFQLFFAALWERIKRRFRRRA
jgi:hypothetical protein